MGRFAYRLTYIAKDCGVEGMSDILLTTDHTEMTAARAQEMFARRIEVGTEVTDVTVLEVLSLGFSSEFLPPRGGPTR